MARRSAALKQTPIREAADYLKDRTAPDPTKSSDMVIVASKLPHSFIMELVNPGRFVDNDGKPMGQNLMPAPINEEERFEIKGANSVRPDRLRAQGHYAFAFTPVPKALWEKWILCNRGLQFVKEGLVFAAPSLEAAKAQAREHHKQMTGLEAMAQEKDPRIKSRTRTPDAQEVETDHDALERALAAST